jgi:putative membrane protein
MMWGYGGGLGFGLGGWLGMIGMVVIVVGVILLIAWLVGRVGPQAQSGPPAGQQPAGHAALELLQLRFARGEITEDEYRSAKKVLEEGR